MNTKRMIGIYESFMLTLSLYVVGQLSIEIILDFSAQTERLLSRIDFAIASIFLADWVVFFALSKNKRSFLRTRFLDLLASIPFVQILRPLRVLRIVRLARTLRLVRGLKGLFPVLRVITANPARSAMSIYLSLTVVIFLYCSVGLYNFEKSVNDQISNFADVLWMAFTTLTSVGYGDLYPVTDGGRIMAVVLVLTGMGLFSLITAEFATIILKLVRNQPKNDAEEVEE